MGKKKIVFLHPAYWEQVMGGAEYQISLLASELKKNKFEIHFVFEDNSREYSNEIGFFLHPLKKIKLRKTFGSYWFVYKKKINEVLNKIEPNIIYTRSYSSWAGFASLYAKYNNCKHILGIASDNDLTRSLKSSKFIRPLDIIESYYMKKAYTNSAEIITQNNFQQDLLLNTYNRKGHLVNQSVPFLNMECKEKKDKNLKVIWIANLKQLKKPEKYIDLVKLFKGRDEVEFFMIGRPSKVYNRLIKEVSNSNANFHFFGELSNDRVNDHLCESHILINTSDYEGFSNTFVQAWMRKVIVLSMNSNPDEIITKQKIGFICPTVNELKNKIELLVTNVGLRNQMGKKAYQYGVENHSLEKNINKVISLMRK